ncbi:MAG: DUF1553 domain-containing protein, partial [Planctomycetales bacterium]|nr:DUF1553 domain-containing protein [Planctomycetales bacterium]
RDYLIRAWNDDVPYNQLVREHLAGDLLASPRWNDELGIRESSLGLGHLRMVYHGYAPTDALDELVTFTDNQIDVISKAFLGVTVSCSRCHDHKFDPISQRDFYKLFGVLASCRPALITVDKPDVASRNQSRLAELKPRIREALADAWTQSATDFARQLTSQSDSEAWKARLEAAAKDDGHPLHAWAVLRGADDETLRRRWNELSTAWKSKQARANDTREKSAVAIEWDLTGEDYADWFAHGNGSANRPSRPGDFHVLPDGESIISNVYPAGVFTHLLTSKHNGVLNSPRFRVDADRLSVRVAGSGGARVRYVMQNYPRAIGLIYQSFIPQQETFRWQHWDMRYWKGDWAHIEIATAGDLPVEARGENDRSWFGIAEVVASSGEAPVDLGLPIFAVLSSSAEPSQPASTSLDSIAPDSSADLAKLYADTIRQAVADWRFGRINDAQAELLGYLVRERLLPNSLESVPAAQPLVAEYRRLESEIQFPTRSPGVLESSAIDQPLFVRGNHKQPADPVPRGFLEALGDQPFNTDASGRLELAEAIVAPDNPLASRVIVNRLWHHLWGRGIATTTDNFGRLGQQPTHPELLDFLAAKFVEDGWSLKRMLRFLVLSESFQATSDATAESLAGDPTNRWLARFPVRRLEAEAIRDSLLAVSGQLDETMFGPGVPGNSRRRSIYVNVRRNNLDPLLSAFDAPEPSSTRGVRDTTNVPAQSLTLLNDPFVLEQAKQWADAVSSEFEKTDEMNSARRIERMWLAAFGRSPTSDEIAACRAFLSEREERLTEVARQRERLTTEIAERREALRRITEPVHARIREQRGSQTRPAGPVDDAGNPLLPIARWEFDDDLRDSIGNLHGVAKGNARLEAGAIVLDGQSFVETAPLKQPLKTKTLEAWVRLDDLNQRGGGVMSVETIGGQTFDAIVFGEKDPRQWLAGSDFFNRTQSLGGTPVESPGNADIHVAIVYASDGRITAYQNG